jgi:RES domain-containing protein
MVRAVWRFAVETPDYGSDDLSGKGSEKSGGRWNRKGTPVIYASSSIAFAYLETMVHLSGLEPLPLNRYLIKIEIPGAAWKARTVFDAARHVGWDALPAGLTSLDWGTEWVQSGTSLVAEVPSIVVPEESNILISLGHPEAAKLIVRKTRRWTFDAAVKDNARGPLLGRMSNGAVLKGHLFPLPDGGQVQVPVSDFVRAGDRRIEGVGVEPDIRVIPSLAEIHAGRDPVVERAVLELRNIARDAALHPNSARLDIAGGLMQCRTCRSVSSGKSTNDELPPIQINLDQLAGPPVILSVRNGPFLEVTPL